METLDERRTKLLLKFAKKKCHKSIQAKDIFKHKEKHHNMELRHTEKYEVNNAATSRYQMSAVPYIQKLLNKHDREEDTHENTT